ncbi:hypothetical protein [Deinococcus sonorensis]|uniref:2'-5' RNA ligase family protein n=2 Tax=Deinococcus sonorensis TaxID=309891 RepID=A0AAU7UF70_9DEIO
MTAAVQFAVYLCPPADDPYYRAGSDLLGYDVRAQQVTALPGFLRPEWQRQARPYGLHLTLVEAYSCDASALAQIEAEVQLIMASLSPGARLSLHRGRVEAWEDGEVLVHRYDPSPHLLMLQAVLTARLSRHATHSPFQDELAEHPDRYPARWERARMQLLLTPRGLDDWQPHYTLVQPYEGPDAAGLVEHLRGLMDGFGEQTHDSVALFVRPDAGSAWHIQAEYRIGGERVGEAARAQGPML